MCGLSPSPRGRFRSTSSSWAVYRPLLGSQCGLKPDKIGSTTETTVFYGCTWIHPSCLIFMTFALMVNHDQICQECTIKYNMCLEEVGREDMMNHLEMHLLEESQENIKGDLDGFYCEKDLNHKQTLRPCNPRGQLLHPRDLPRPCAQLDLNQIIGRHNRILEIIYFTSTFIVDEVPEAEEDPFNLLEMLHVTDIQHPPRAGKCTKPVVVFKQEEEPKWLILSKNIQRSLR